MSGLLYRDYRPQAFADLVAQVHVVKTLQEALRQGKIAHAYLFCGPRGIGKTTMARLLAKGVNCSAIKNGEPCGVCDACVSITAGRAIDVLEIDAASNRGIDEIRQLREKVRVSPTSLLKRVVIIDEAHMLTKEAFNALLKTLEEPPAHTIFILATTEPHKIHATIISRCQRFDFHRLSATEIATHLASVVKKEGREAEEGALRLMARAASGSSRDALSLLSQALLFPGLIAEKEVRTLLGLSEDESVEAILIAMLDGEGAKALILLRQVQDDGKDLAVLRSALLEKARSWMLAAAGVPDVAGAERRPETATLSVMQKTISQLLEASRLAPLSPMPELPLEAAIVTLAGVNVAPVVVAPALQNVVNKHTHEEEKPKEPIVPVGVREEATTAEQLKKPTTLSVTIDQIISGWPDIQKRIRKANTTLGISFQTLIPLRLEGTELVLGCAFDLHCKRWKSDDARKTFAKAFTETFGEDAIIRVLHDSELDEASRATLVTWRKRQGEATQQEERHPVGQARAVFGAKPAAVEPKPVDRLINA